MTDQAIQQSNPQDQELARYTADDGTNQVLTLSAINYWFCNQATPADAALFAARCRAARLNPFAGDATLIKYGDAPASVIISKDALVKRADRQPDFQGMEHGVVFANKNEEVMRREGQAIYKALGEVLLGAWCKVYRKDRKPIYAEVTFDEYNTGKSLWRTKPAIMIDKVAQATALRNAYPQEMAGLYEASEITADGNIPNPTKAPQAPKISDEVRQELEHINQSVGDKRAVWDAYKAGGVEAARALVQPEQPEDDAEIEF